MRSSATEPVTLEASVNAGVSERGLRLYRALFPGELDRPPDRQPRLGHLDREQRLDRSWFERAGVAGVDARLRLQRFEAADAVVANLVAKGAVGDAHARGAG